MTKGKLFATDNIGHDARTGQPQYKKGAEIPSDHPNIDKWKQWGMVTDVDPNAKQGDKKKTSTPRPSLIPIFPIKQDVSTADTENESEEDKKIRAEAQSLSNLSGKDQEKIEAAKAANREQLAAKQGKTKLIVQQVKEADAQTDEPSTDGVKGTDSEDRAKATADKAAVARDKKAAKDADKLPDPKDDDDSDETDDAAEKKAAAAKKTADKAEDDKKTDAKADKTDAKPAAKPSDKN